MLSKGERLSDRERLLKLIDGDPSVLGETQKARPLREFFAIIRGSISFLQENFLKGIQELFTRVVMIFGKVLRGQFSLKSIRTISVSRILLAVLLLLVASIFFDLVRGMHISKSDFDGKAFDQRGSQSADQFVTLGTLEYYLDQIRGKDIFNVRRIESKVATGGLPVADGLKFVGVDWGAQPTAMIEDLQNAKTYFVKKGDTIKELTVVEILRDRVRVGFKDQLFELK